MPESAGAPVGPDGRFAQLARDEPPKGSAWSAEGRPPRRASAIVLDRPGGGTFEGVVDLDEGRVVSWNGVDAGRPALLLADYGTTVEVVRADPRVAEALRRRGIADPLDVQVDAWAPGPDAGPGARTSRALFYHRPRGIPSYIRPIGGLAAHVDLDRRRVIGVLDLGEAPVSKEDGGLGADPRPEPAQAPAPDPAEPPRGVGLDRRGREVRWRGWRLRHDFHPRDGLILREVGHEDGGRVRPILYRGSLSELLVPYGDPDPDWSFRNAFDEGEYGIGRFANSLEPGVDCPEGASFEDAVLADDDGAPYTIPRAVGIYERDGGVLWKHSARGRPEARRSRELVVCSFATLGNYVYGFHWIFRQDGSIAVEVVLTGIMLTKGVRDDAPPADRDVAPTGHTVAPGVVAVHHQHFFNFRLDLDVDGPGGNRVSEMNAEALPPGDDNPLGNAFTIREDDLTSERKARRSMSLATGRRWKVSNPGVRTPLGQPAGYRLVPGENALPFADTSAPIRRRAGFLDAHLWATRFHPAELHAGGPYPNQNPGNGGLGRPDQADRSLVNTDVVLWYTMGITHAPRPEDWPVMPAHRAGFALVPDGFFARNPALDLPPPAP